MTDSPRQHVATIYRGVLPTVPASCSRYSGLASCWAPTRAASTRAGISKRVEAARAGAQQLASPEYREQLAGTAGSTPL